MMRRFRLLFVCLILCVAVVDDSQAQPTPDLWSPQELPVSERGQVVGIIDGDTVTFSDGREVRLTGIQAPKLPLSRPNFKAWPLASESKTALETLALDRQVTLHVDGNGQDRHRRILAHVVTSDGTWLQGEMVARGMARVYTFADNRRLGATLLEQEKIARAAGLGIWRLAYYRIRASEPAALEPDVGSFQLVQGRVAETARVRNWTYLNFGEDYRTDFTISVNRRDLNMFESAGLDLLALEGRKVRVRGWLKDFNGPLIQVTQPEQIEILSD